MLPRLRPHNALSYPRTAALAGASVGRVSRAAARNAGARFSVIGLQRFLVNAGVDAGGALPDRQRGGRRVWPGGGGGCAGGPVGGKSGRSARPDAVTRIGADWSGRLRPDVSASAVAAPGAAGAHCAERRRIRSGHPATLIAHQTIVYGLDPAARSRLNALLFTGVFIGMASGAVLSSRILASAGWPGVVALATAAGPWRCGSAAGAKRRA